MRVCVCVCDFFPCQTLQELHPKQCSISNFIASGGCFVEGEWLRNAFRWKASIGPWENRPGHFGDVWMYWTDDGLGYFEFLQAGITCISIDEV